MNHQKESHADTQPAFIPSRTQRSTAILSVRPHVRQSTRRQSLALPHDRILRQTCRRCPRLPSRNGIRHFQRTLRSLAAQFTGNPAPAHVPGYFGKFESEFLRLPPYYCYCFNRREKWSKRRSSSKIKNESEFLRLPQFAPLRQRR